jgi:glycerol kinase
MSLPWTRHHQLPGGLFDRRKIVSIASKEFQQIYPQPGWVEHDPMEIWDSQMEAARRALDSASLSLQSIAAIGITNQRETTVVWDRESGKPVYNAIVWQCRRTAPACSRIQKTKFAEKLRRKTGLVVDAYFSGTKVQWILEHDKKIRKAAERGDLAFGTIDSWLVYRLTGKKLHLTDYSNASRTLLFNIHDLSWDREILRFLDIPEKILPVVKRSSQLYGHTSPGSLLRGGSPIVRNHRGSAGCAFRTDVLPPGAGQKHLWHRLFPPHEYGREASGLPHQSPDDHRVGYGKESRICPGGKCFHRRGGGSMAPRRPADHRPGLGQRTLGGRPFIE